MMIICSELSVEALKEKSPLALELLFFLTCVPLGVSIEELIAVMQIYDQNLKEQEIMDAIGELKKLSLCSDTKDKEFISLTPFMTNYTKQLLSP